MKTFKQFMKEQASNTQWGTWNSRKWEKDEQEWDSNRYTGLEDRLKKDPVARLGYKIAKNPDSGTVDSIDDIDSKGTEKNLLGQVGTRVSPVTGDVKKDSLRLRTDMPPVKHDRNYDKLSEPKLDYQLSGDVKAHELGHLGTNVIKNPTKRNPDDIEKEQRWRDTAKSSPDSTQYEKSSSYIMNDILKRDVTDYDEWKNYAGQLSKQIPKEIENVDKEAEKILNDPDRLSKLRATYWKK